MWYYEYKNILNKILMGDKQGEQNDVTINGTSEIYSKLIFQ